MNLVSLPRLNELRFPADPQPMPKLWRWCREGRLPARKVGGEWFVDLEAFDRGEKGMSPQQFSELCESIRQAGQIRRGEIAGRVLDKLGAR